MASRLGKLIGIWILEIGDCNQLTQFGLEEDGKDVEPYPPELENEAIAEAKAMARTEGNLDTYHLLKVYDSGQVETVYVCSGDMDDDDFDDE